MASAFWTGYFEKLAIVAAVLIALWLLACRLRRLTLFRRGEGCASVLESVPLSPQAALYVVKAGSRRFLIGSGVSTIAELEDDA